MNSPSVFLSITVLVVAALALASGFRVPSGDSGVCVAGDVRARELAYVAPDLRAHYFDARTMALGLGTAAVGSWESLGDAIAVGGRLWLRSTNEQSPRFYQLVSNPYFLSNHFTYIAPGYAPARAVDLRTHTLTAAWEKVLAGSDSGVMVGGYLRFASLHTIAIARAPLRAMPVTAHVPRYYVRPMETRHNVWAYVVGIGAAPDAGPALLARALNRDDAEPGIVHVLILNAEPGDKTAPPAPAMVTSLGRALAHSIVEQGRLQIYSLQSLRDCVTDKPRVAPSLDIPAQQAARASGALLLSRARLQDQ